MNVTASSFSKDLEMDNYNAFYNPEDWYKNYLADTDKIIHPKASAVATSKVNVTDLDN